jgi:hypothetical protein
MNGRPYPCFRAAVRRFRVRLFAPVVMRGGRGFHVYGRPFIAPAGSGLFVQMRNVTFTRIPPFGYTPTISASGNARKTASRISSARRRRLAPYRTVRYAENSPRGPRAFVNSAAGARAALISAARFAALSRLIRVAFVMTVSCIGLVRIARRNPRAARNFPNGPRRRAAAVYMTRVTIRVALFMPVHYAAEEYPSSG